MRLGLIGTLDGAFHTRIAAQVDVLVAPGEPCDALLAWDVQFEAVAQTLTANPRLPWMHMSWAGVPPALLDLLDGHPVILTNGSGAHAPAIAEFVVAALLGHYHRLTDLRAQQERHVWRVLRGAELRGRTVGIVGTGDIGSAVATLLKPFGLRLLGLNRSGRAVTGFSRIYTRHELPSFLAQLDVLVLAAPLTPESRGLIDAQALATLPPHCYLVNVGRGALLDEPALIAALQSGQLAGAALDVFVDEPLPADSPLWSLPNVLVAPHCSDHTDGTEQRGLELFLDNLCRFKSGLPVANIVDRVAGY
jgi:phosphoglycerate dehydrogenase-like enzyme